MASTDLTAAEQKQMQEALSKGETPPNFGGVVTMDGRTGRWRKAAKEEADAHYAATSDAPRDGAPVPVEGSKP